MYYQSVYLQYDRIKNPFNLVFLKKKTIEIQSRLTLYDSLSILMLQKKIHLYVQCTSRAAKLCNKHCVVVFPVSTKFDEEEKETELPKEQQPVWQRPRGVALQLLFSAQNRLRRFYTELYLYFTR